MATKQKYRTNLRLRSPASTTNKNLSEDDIPNVNFYAVRLEATRIRWNNTKITLLCPSRLLKVTDFGANRKLIYDFLLVINTSLPPILHRLRDIAVDRSEIAILGYPLVFNSPGGGVPLRRSPWNFQWMSMEAKVHNAVEILPKIWTVWLEHTSVTDDRQTDGR